ncbi:DUF302 domain-containing protein [Phyllobacterium sp. LjRoot231]|uniref:DUF302 domain-containing protein n=1 Tax=Phyllobacterium sp. LjRoot231 TaxID=3342289 RepID=UPI003F4FEABB
MPIEPKRAVRLTFLYLFRHSHSGCSLPSRAKFHDFCDYRSPSHRPIGCSGDAADNGHHLRHSLADTPMTLAAPDFALELPLEVLVREGEDGKTYVQSLGDARGAAWAAFGNGGTLCSGRKIDRKRRHGGLEIARMTCFANAD